MRKRIRLTGRRQLPKSCISVSIATEDDKKVVTAQVSDKRLFERLPGTARMRLRLNENKFSEVLEFGTLDKPITKAELKNRAFRAPSCQLRIVNVSDENRGLLLGSTDTWTLRADDDIGAAGSEGILLFQPMDLAPRTWRLEIRDSDYPIVYVDKSVPDAAVWVRSDPVFVSMVLPSIVQTVFSEIVASDAREDIAWMQDWMKWADVLMPGSDVPTPDTEEDKKDEWLDSLVNAFSLKHGLIAKLMHHVSDDKVNP